MKNDNDFFFVVCPLLKQYFYFFRWSKYIDMLCWRFLGRTRRKWMEKNQENKNQLTKVWKRKGNTGRKLRINLLEWNETKVTIFVGQKNEQDDVGITCLLHVHRINGPNWWKTDFVFLIYEHLTVNWRFFAFSLVNWHFVFVFTNMSNAKWSVQLVRVG